MVLGNLKLRLRGEFSRSLNDFSFSSWALIEFYVSYGKLLKRIGNVVISTAIAANTTNSNTPTINSFPLTATSSIGLNSLLDPVLLPSSEWDNFPSGIGFDSSSLLDTSYPPIGFSDIDLSSLSGPEYADSAFEWGNFNQFSALGNF